MSVGTKRIVYYQIVNESVSLNSAPDYASDPIEPIIRWYRDGRLIAANKRLITFVAESGLNGSVYRFTVSEFRGDVIFESEDVVLIVGGIQDLYIGQGGWSICSSRDSSLRVVERTTSFVQRNVERYAENSTRRRGRSSSESSGREAPEQVSRR